MARHALQGKRVQLPPGLRPRRHRSLTVWERLVLVATTWLAIQFSLVR